MSGSGPLSLAWLQMAIEEQDLVELKSQVNVAARRIDILVGNGLRAALEPDRTGERLALHGALRFDEAAGETARTTLLERLDRVDDSGTEYAEVGAGWLAFRRWHAVEDVATAGALAERFRDFLAESLAALRDADREGIL